MAEGQVVLVEGLQSRPELNEQFAVVLELGERWRCQIVSTGERIRLKPANAVAYDDASTMEGAPDAPASSSRAPRPRLKAADFASLQAAVDAAPEGGAVVLVERDYNEMIRISRPVSLVGVISSDDGTSKEPSEVKKLWRVAGVAVDLPNAAGQLVEVRNLQMGSAATWLGGAGLRVFDGSPVVVNCTIGGMFAVRVDSFKVRSIPVFFDNRLEGRLGGVWWDGACWEGLPGKGADALPISPAVLLEAGGMPKFVLETAAANHFSGDLRWVCCVDSGVLALLTGDNVIPLELPGPEDQQRQALAAEIKACAWFVHRPTLALMDRPDLVKERAAWELIASQDENKVRLEIQSKKAYSEAEQIRHWRNTGMLLPESFDDVPVPAGPLPLPEGVQIEELLQPATEEVDTDDEFR